MYEENNEILTEYYENLNGIVGFDTSHRALYNLEPIKKVLAHTRLLAAVIETEKENHAGDDFKKACQDFKNGIKNTTSPIPTLINFHF